MDDALVKATWWVFGATFLLFAATAAGAGLLVVELKRARRAEKEAHEVQRKISTIRFYTSTEADRNAWARDLPHERDAFAIKGKILAARDDSNVEHQIRTYLNHWELLAAAAHEKVFDAGLLRRLVRSITVQLATNYAGYILARRQSLHSAQDLYSNLESLAWMWANPGEKDVLERAFGSQGHGYVPRIVDPPTAPRTILRIGKFELILSPRTAETRTDSEQAQHASATSEGNALQDGSNPHDDAASKNSASPAGRNVQPPPSRDSAKPVLMGSDLLLRVWLI